MEFTVGGGFLLGLIGGFFGGTLVCRQYWIQVYRKFAVEVSSQYKSILETFGIYKNSNGNWEMKNEEGLWLRK